VIELKLPIGLKSNNVVAQAQGKLSRWVRGARGMNKKIVAGIVYACDKAQPGVFRLKFFERKEIIPNIIQGNANMKSEKAIRELKGFLHDDCIRPFKFYEAMKLPENEIIEVEELFEDLLKIDFSFNREFILDERKKLARLQEIVEKTYDAYERDTQELIDSVKVKQ
jgi:hypothetical protein